MGTRIGSESTCPFKDPSCTAKEEAFGGHLHLLGCNHATLFHYHHSTPGPSLGVYTILLPATLWGACELSPPPTQPHLARPLKNLPMAMKSSWSEQLNTTVWMAKALPRSLVVSVLPVPAGPAGAPPNLR